MIKALMLCAVPRAYHKPSVSHDLCYDVMSYDALLSPIIYLVVMSSLFMSSLLLGRFHDLTQRHIVYCVMSFSAAHILYRNVICYGYTPLGEVVFCTILFNGIVCVLVVLSSSREMIYALLAQRRG